MIRPRPNVKRETDLYTDEGRGLGDKPVITAIFLGGIFEMSYSMIAGIRAVDPQQVNAARIMGLRGGEMLLTMITWGLGKMIYEARFWNDVQVMLEDEVKKEILMDKI